MHNIDRVVFTFCFILFVAVCTALYGFWTNPDNLLRPAATHATSTAAAEKTSPGRSQPACGKRTYRRCFSGAKPKYWHMNIGSYRRQLIHYPSDTRLTVKQGKSIWIQGKGIFLHLWQEIRLCLPFQPSDKYIIHQQPILSEHKLSVGEKFTAEFSFHEAPTRLFCWGVILTRKFTRKTSLALILLALFSQKDSLFRQAKPLCGSNWYFDEKPGPIK